MNREWQEKEYLQAGIDRGQDFGRGRGRDTLIWPGPGAGFWPGPGPGPGIFYWKKVKNVEKLSLNSKFIKTVNVSKMTQPFYLFYLLCIWLKSPGPKFFKSYTLIKAPNDSTYIKVCIMQLSSTTLTRCTIYSLTCSHHLPCYCPPLLSLHEVSAV